MNGFSETMASKAFYGVDINLLLILALEKLEI